MKLRLVCSIALCAAAPLGAATIVQPQPAPMVSAQQSPASVLFGFALQGKDPNCKKDQCTHNNRAHNEVCQRGVIKALDELGFGTEGSDLNCTQKDEIRTRTTDQLKQLCTDFAQQGALDTDREFISPHVAQEFFRAAYGLLAIEINRMLDQVKGQTPAQRRATPGHTGPTHTAAHAQRHEAPQHQQPAAQHSTPSAPPADAETAPRTQQELAAMLQAEAERQHRKVHGCTGPCSELNEDDGDETSGDEEAEGGDLNADGSRKRTHVGGSAGSTEEGSPEGDADALGQDDVESVTGEDASE